MNVVFFGTSEVGLPIIRDLHAAHKILAVVSNPDAPVGRKQIITPSPISSYAMEEDLPLLRPEKVKNNPEFLEQLKNLNADIFIVVSYGKILPEALLNIPRLKTINIHFSLLPQYRGASPIQYALLKGETTTGTTIFVLDEEVDHGPILAQTKVDIHPDDTFASLAPKLSEASSKLLLETLPRYDSGALVPEPQNHANATSTGLITKEQGKVDWKWTGQQIYNQYRALHLWPGLWTTWQEKIFKILDCHLTNDSEEDAVNVVCGDGSLLAITILQVEGKTAMTAKEFLNGKPDFNPQELK